MGGKALKVAAAGFRLPDLDVDFRPRFPWLGGDLQTLRNQLRRRRADLSPWPPEAQLFPVGDGSGDRLLARLHLHVRTRG